MNSKHKSMMTILGLPISFIIGFIFGLLNIFKGGCLCVGVFSFLLYLMIAILFLTPMVFRNDIRKKENKKTSSDKN